MNFGNRLVLIGNGFDLSHGLKTTYHDFVEWYLCNCVDEFSKRKGYSDALLQIKYNNPAIYFSSPKAPQNLPQAIEMLSSQFHSTNFVSGFFKELLDSFAAGNWVNIECQYFHKLKAIFENGTNSKFQKHQRVKKLNAEFNCLIEKLSEYFTLVNGKLSTKKGFAFDSSSSNLGKAFSLDESHPVTFVNFNYTDTLYVLDYANPSEIIHIHGRVSDPNNPVIFGYGDESDPAYQKIEDCGDNVFLEHIKSFGYFQANNYRKLIELIDAAPYKIYIVGHSCGMSDRILLNEIFEHPNCKQIEIFYHKRQDGSDNYKEITQEISRHFKSQNKNLFRRRVKEKDARNFIPQNASGKIALAGV